MTFWAKLQHELLCFVCAEDDIFWFCGRPSKRAFPLSSRYACIICSAALWFKYFLIRLLFMIWNDDTRTMLEIWGFRVIVESNITPRCCACDEGVICESPIVINGRETFDNCWRDPNGRNSVFSSFNFKKFCLIQLRISWIHFSSVVIHESAGSWEDLKVM